MNFMLIFAMFNGRRGYSGRTIVGDFVEYDASAFKEYDEYDKANPNRFDVKYDENLNRIWD